MPLTQSVSADTGLTGLSGFVADVIAELGAVGVGLLVLLETLFPPVPSEVVLPLAGFLGQQGRMSLVAVLVASTTGSVLGAVAFYGLGARLGAERSAALVGRVPLMDAADADRAQHWFVRHGPAAVFFGRLVPGVRSLVSIPAGTTRMRLPTFLLLTAAGSGLWNGLLIGAGALLGTQWHRVREYADVLDRVVIAVLVVLVLWAVLRRLRGRRAGR